jgi:Uma2 family endonuclease
MGLQTVPDILYPESDDQRWGESDLHRAWMIRLYDLLDWRYREQKVYVASDLIMYFVEGNPWRSLVPDVMVVKDCDRGDRLVFKTWEERRVPSVVFEVTSQSTRKNDEEHKPAIYADMGVQELFLFDPTSDWLAVPLQGYRLVGGDFVSIERDETGSLESQELGIRLTLEEGRLILLDVGTRELLLTPAEAANARADHEAEARAEEAQGRAEETQARVMAESRLEEEIQARKRAEEELERLREQLKRDDRN